MTAWERHVWRLPACWRLDIAAGADVCNFTPKAREALSLGLQDYTNHHTFA